MKPTMRASRSGFGITSVAPVTFARRKGFTQHRPVIVLASLDLNELGDVPPLATVEEVGHSRALRFKT